MSGPGVAVGTEVGRLRPPDLSVRRSGPELMDDPSLDRERHVAALTALARVNRVSGTAGRIVREVARLHRREDRPIRVLDVACGGGDVVGSVATRLRRDRVPAEIHGCDVSAVALEVAAERWGGAGVRFFPVDVLAEPMPRGYDLLCSSLFLHHLTEDDATRHLRAMADATTCALLVQDLRRTRLGYLFAYLGLAVLTRSDVARADGLTSVAAAYTLSEARTLCSAAGLAPADVRPAWPQRFTIRWAR